MTISIFDLFKVGIGPSSSHTIGPMKAAKSFRKDLKSNNLLRDVNSIEVSLYGSLALTGVGHGTDKAIILGLSGCMPETILPVDAENIMKKVSSRKFIELDNGCKISWTKDHIKFFRRESLPPHPNGMKFTAFDKMKNILKQDTYFSIGGGFVVKEEELDQGQVVKNKIDLPYPFRTGAELLKMTADMDNTIAALVIENEKKSLDLKTIYEKIDHIWSVMDSCILRGLTQEGILPGGLKVRRRAAAIYQKLSKSVNENDPLRVLDWVNLYALAVNEENAAGSRVVTAPTNGAAGIIPAVLKYYQKFCNGTSAGVREFILTAGAIGILYKENASISGAEVGCQGEVGVACSMAAAGLAAVLGGIPNQVEQAAEIGMEHNLGLTCDPVGGLVQIPCIERNAMGAVKAINAARIALQGDGYHFVSLDSVMKTMKQTGEDMRTKYKETSRGGLAVNVTEC